MADEPEAEAQPEAKGEKEQAANAEPDQPNEAGDTEESAPAAEDAPPASEGSEDSTVPVAAQQAERKKRQEAEKRAEESEKRLQELERRLAGLEQPKQETPQEKAPDPFDDPDGYREFVERRTQAAIFNERLNTSEVFARQQFGDDAVNDAQRAFKEAVQNEPWLAQKLQTANPYGEVMKWHRQQQLLREIGDDPEAYRQRILQEAMGSQERPQAAPEPSSRPSTPPPLSKGGAVPSADPMATEEDFFNEVFSKS